MQEFVDLGATTPHEEPCAQVGAKDYDYTTRARIEGLHYIQALKQKFGPPPEGAELRLKSHPHDFGSYLTVVCYHDQTQAATDYAYRCESEGPATWEEVGMTAPQWDRGGRRAR